MKAMKAWRSGCLQHQCRAYAYWPGDCTHFCSFVCGRLTCFSTHLFFDALEYEAFHLMLWGNGTMVALLAYCLLWTQWTLVQDAEQEFEVENVLKPGMTLVAENANGELRITSESDIQRDIRGKDWKKNTRMLRRKERWNGSLGIYSPGRSNGRTDRLVYSEGQLFFDSESDALKYLYVGSLRSKPIYTNDGLVFSFYESQGPRGMVARSVEVFQIYIQGKKPTQLRGADDDAIKLEGGTTAESAEPQAAPVGYEIIPGKEEYQPAKTADVNDQ